MKAFRSIGPLDSVRTYNEAKHLDKNIFFQWIKIIARRFGHKGSLELPPSFCNGLGTIYIASFSRNDL